MKNSCLNLLLILLFLFPGLIASAQSEYISQDIFGEYITSGYANKKFIQHGKTDKEGLKQGSWTDFSFAETLVFINEQGEWQEKEGTFLLKHVGQFKDDKKTGIWKSYLLEHPSKKEILLREIKFIGNLPNGEYKVYYPSGKIFIEGNHSMGENNGKITSYFESGQKQTEISCQMGLRTGDCRNYYRSGALAGVTHFVNDTLDGEAVKYYADGKLQEVSHVKMGKMDGIYQYYYDNGQMWTERLYVEDRLMEVNLLVDRAGRTMERGTFVSGNGALYFYDETGKPYNKQTFENGVKTAEEEYASEPEWYKRN